MRRLITIVIAATILGVGARAQDEGPFNLYFNWHADASVSNTGGRFENKDLRLEIKGDLSHRLFYRFRQQLTRPMTPGTLDHFSKGTDLMYLGWKAADNVSVMVGKQCQYFGGFEYELNPIFVYEYSDFLNRMSIFKAGVTVAWKPVPEHELVAMVTSSSNDRFSDMYSFGRGQSYKDSKAPFEYILNWNSSLMDGMLLSRWAVSAASVAEGKWTKLILGGEKFCLPRFQVFVDYMAAWDDIDRLQYATEDGAAFLDPASGLSYFENVVQHTFLAKAEWQFAPRWNLWVKGMYETVSVRDVPQMNNYRKSLGYMSGIEYHPFEEQDVRFYLAYFGRRQAFSQACGLTDIYGNRVELGLMCRLKAR